ncbi:TetR family transcriptional regulator [Planomonospora sp. ID82291]|uniref:TetR family transcriptional regulator n=1 Tax=Planomonospora sp. ID82291 TaxID=2738136 RepID=UPI0018C3C0A1|nr:TetR family transcriptional regulator [Planomonospora sp. ID82291]MBG0814134.1 TetR/AcrR family transcriptional regulator [Planomonospora sp. ID82291]
MPYDPQRTRQVILDAAVEEFSTHGLAGARVSRIAARAKVNKERLYGNFGSKEELFDVVLARELARLAGALPLTDDQAADLSAYALAVHDYHRDHPHFVRLVHWEGLERGSTVVVGHLERAAHYRSRVETIARAQGRGDLPAEIAPAQLLYGVFAMAVWWAAVPQLTMLITGSADDDERRRALAAMVARLTRREERPGQPGRPG